MQGLANERPHLVLDSGDTQIHTPRGLDDVGQHRWHVLGGDVLQHISAVAEVRYRALHGLRQVVLTELELPAHLRIQTILGEVQPDNIAPLGDTGRSTPSTAPEVVAQLVREGLGYRQEVIRQPLTGCEVPVLRMRPPQGLVLGLFRVHRTGIRN